LTGYLCLHTQVAVRRDAILGLPHITSATSSLALADTSPIRTVPRASRAVREETSRTLLTYDEEIVDAAIIYDQHATKRHETIINEDIAEVYMSWLM
jgi:hypothetical protein